MRVMRSLLLVTAMGSPILADAREVQGFQLAERVSVAEWGLELNLASVATAERNYLPFYLVALYRDLPNFDPEGLARGMMPCRIAITWLAPQVTAKDAETYWMDAFKHAAEDEEQFSRLKPAVQRLARAAGAAQRGDVLVFDYHPDGGMRLDRNGVRVGQFPGLEFNRILLGVWLGPKAPKSLREPLLAQPPAVQMR